MSYGFLNRLHTALRAEPEDGLTNILADLAVGHPDDRLETLASCVQNWANPSTWMAKNSWNTDGI